VIALDALLDGGADIERGGAVFTDGAAMSDAVIFAQWNCARRLLERGAKTTLTQAAALLAGAKAVVANDSGLMHLAAALGRPLVALFGPSDPALTPPLADDAAVLALDLDCQPCHARRCPLVHHKCLEELSPRVVSERLAPILDQAAHHP
jgi:lipopolysaccharide heptosyltransferase II